MATDAGMRARLVGSGLGLQYQPGRRAVNTLRVAANVASTEYVSIGDDVYEVNIVNTDSTKTVTGTELANTGITARVTMAAHGLSVGALIRVENEIMLVTKVVDVNTIDVSRGYSGTTIASHAASTAIYVAAAAFTAGRFPVGLVTTLTPAAFTAALVAVINAKRGVAPVSAVKISDNEVLVYADREGAYVATCGDGLAGVNNGWAATAMYGGIGNLARKLVAQSRVPTAVEVALGNMHFMFPFVPTVVEARVYVTATPGVAVDWDGAVTVTGKRVTIDNAGSTDWSASHTVVLVVTGA